MTSEQKSEQVLASQSIRRQKTGEMYEIRIGDDVR